MQSKKQQEESFMLERFPDSSTKMLTHCSFILKRHERQVSPSLKAKNFLRVSVTPAICLRRELVYQISGDGARVWREKVSWVPPALWELETTITTFNNNIILRAHLEHSES